MARVRQVTTAAAAAVVLRALHSAILLGICLEDEKHSFMMKGNLLSVGAKEKELAQTNAFPLYWKQILQEK